MHRPPGICGGYLILRRILNRTLPRARRPLRKADAVVGPMPIRGAPPSATRAAIHAGLGGWAFPRLRSHARSGCAVGYLLAAQHAKTSDGLLQRSSWI